MTIYLYFLDKMNNGLVVTYLSRVFGWSCYHISMV